MIKIKLTGGRINLQQTPKNAQFYVKIALTILLFILYFGGLFLLLWSIWK